MTKKIVMIALVACHTFGTALAQDSAISNTQSQLRRAGFSQSMISKMKRSTKNSYRGKVAASSVWTQQDSLPPITTEEISTATSETPILNPIPQPAEPPPTEETPPTEAASPGPSAQPAEQPASVSSVATETKPLPKASKPAKKKKKTSAKKKKSSAPVVQSAPEMDETLSSGNYLPSPYSYGQPTQPSGGNQEIYSQ
ncbi:hypothetical protein HYY75_11620, partial [bacterium]|nr:hypothetical protein [bacterium]